MASIACSAKLMSLLIHRLGFFFCLELFFPKEKSLVRWRLGLVARVGWLGAVLSLLTFLSGKKVSVFFCELFFPKRKVENSQPVKIGNLEISENSKGVTSLPLFGGKVKVTQCFVGAVLVDVRVSRYGNFLANEHGFEFVA